MLPLLPAQCNPAKRAIEIKIWNLTTGKLDKNLLGHEGEVKSLAFDATGGPDSIPVERCLQVDLVSTDLDLPALTRAFADLFAGVPDVCIRVVVSFGAGFEGCPVSG